MSSFIDGSLAVAGIVTAMMVSVLVLRGGESSEVSVLNSEGKEPFRVKKAA